MKLATSYKLIPNTKLTILIAPVEPVSLQRSGKIKAKTGTWPDESAPAPMLLINI